MLGEVISAPSAPTGPDTVYSSELVTLLAGGAISNLHHQIEYRFDFDAEGNHDYSDWSSSDSTSKEWSDPGTYTVKAQARCAKHNDIVSPWSTAVSVTAVEPPVTKPTPSEGPASTKTDEPESYCTGGAESKDGGPVEYRFDFDATGAHDTTTWSDQTCVSHSWPIVGTYVARAQARSALETSKVSPWSNGVTITVNNRFISTPRKPLGPSVISWESELYCTGGAKSSDGDPIEYQFAFVQGEPQPGRASHATQNEWHTIWSSDSCATFEWPSQGTCYVKARARSSTQTNELSAWSEELIVSPKQGQRPELRFATHIMQVSNGSHTTISKPYNQNALDTVGMFCPFSISYHGLTANGTVRAYSYFSRIQLEGQNRWATDLSDTIRYFPNVNNPTIPNGRSLPSRLFYVAARCFDSEGFSSNADTVSGEGVCRVVINHDPDTRMLIGLCLFTPQSTGYPDTLVVDFSDGIPDTLPYNSRLRFAYDGWDDKRDSLQYQPPLPIRYQFAYHRWAIDEHGNIAAEKRSPWYPLTGPEDTNPSDDGPASRDRDSTTMRVGTFMYNFSARSFDEQLRPDGTPPVVSFVGNFSPAIDSVVVGFFDQVSHVFREPRQDTLIIGWTGVPLASRGDTINPYAITFDPGVNTVTKSYRFIVRAGGHDDRRDPPGSGIKGWTYSITDFEEEYPYYEEGEWQFDEPLNTIDQELVFKITVPYAQALTDSIVKNSPAFLGAQVVGMIGMDISDTEIFREGIRGITPRFDPNGNPIPGNYWIENEYYLAAYAKTATMAVPIYLKLVM